MRRAPRLAALALLATACGEDPPPPTGDARVEVVGYDYDVDLVAGTAKSVVTVRLLDPGNCVTLASRAMIDLATVTLGGEPATATTTDTQLTACGTGWEAGTELALATDVTLATVTWGQSQVGYTIRDDGGGGQQHYLLSWVEQCDRHGPCDPSPGTFATYRFTVHHAAGATALCPGERSQGPTATTCTFTHPGGPTYSTFGVVTSTAWQTTDLGDWDGVRATLYDRPGSGMGARIDPAYHRGFLARMTAWFGPYPYGDELRLATGPTYWSGFEHPGNIMLDDGLATGTSLYTRPVAHVVNHELAHQWAGDETTLADTYDFVWKEAMAEYLSFVYEDETEPAVGQATAAAWKRFAQGARFHPVPEEDPRPSLLAYYGEVYGPGPMILFRQLEALSSRAQVIAALQQVLGSPRALSVDELVAALETSTGLDLDRYVDVWIRGSGAPVWPTFRVSLSGAAPDQTVTVVETTPGGVLHGCNFAVGLRGAGGETAKVAIVRGVDGVASVTVPTGVAWTATGTILDVDNQCLAFPAAGLARVPLHPEGWSPWRGDVD